MDFSEKRDLNSLDEKRRLGERRIDDILWILGSRRWDFR